MSKKTSLDKQRSENMERVAVLLAAYQDVKASHPYARFCSPNDESFKRDIMNGQIRTKADIVKCFDAARALWL